MLQSLVLSLALLSAPAVGMTVSSPPKIKLYTHTACPFAQRVWIALEATGLPFEKVDVNGPNTHPMWKYLKEQKKEPGLAGFLGGDIKWNFAKFLVGRDGAVLSRYPPTTSPNDIEPDIVNALSSPP